MKSLNGCNYLTDEEAAQFYGGEDFGFAENEYTIIGDDVYVTKKSKAKRIDYPQFDSRWCGKVKPRNIEQRAAMDMLLDEDSTIKLLTGTWGTGKTFLMTAFAMQELEAGKYDQIVYIRNNIDVKDTTPLGALPGTEFEKLYPFIGPLMDNCGGEEGIMRLVESRKLQVPALGYIRGRSFKNSIVMCTEAENMTKEQLQLLIARIGEGSILIIDADCRQRDKAVFEKSKGVETMIERLSGNRLFSCVHLLKSERSETAALADLLND